MIDLPQLRSRLLSSEQQRVFLEDMRGLLSVERYQHLEAMTQLLPELIGLLEQKDMSLERLRRLLFGPTTERSKKRGEKNPTSRKTGKRPGHGRRGQEEYTGAKRVKVPHASLQEGDKCPECDQGKLRRQKQPATTVTVSAQPPVGATVYEQERLRCDTCGAVHTAALPTGVEPQKYAPTVGVLVGLLRYGSGMPFYRLERLQESVGVPLPASIQWEQAERTAQALEPVVTHLIFLGAQAAIVYTDDTSMRVRQLRQEIQAEAEPKRTGIFTTGMVCEIEDQRIQLFFTGRQHAGENLAQVLSARNADLNPPLHMSDALACNEPKGQPTRSCKCVVHARRNFVEIKGTFPEECQKVVDSLAVVYKTEAECRAAGLEDQARLKVHQAQSGPELEKLQTWFDEVIDQKKVEPNSALGQAIQYMRTRWEELTRFLVVPGAPIDNNISERLLKTSILHRKNSLQYLTTRGAEVGDLFMTVIQTCQASGTNPYKYMEAVVKNQEAVKANPGKWLPWNYEASLAAVGDSQPV